MNLTEREIKNRQTIEYRKPEAWEKIKNIPNQIKAGKSIALMQLIFDLKCQMRCEHCGIQGFIDHKKDRKLSVKDVKKLADQAHEYGLYSLCISGGEPLIFPDLEELIDAIGPQRFVLSMDTNGLALTEEKIKWLVEKGVDRIHLSIDGMSDNHSKFRKVKSNSWSHNIEMLPLCKKNNLGMVINIVATKDLVRSGEIEKQLEFLKTFDQHCSLIYAKPVGTFEEAKDQVLNSNDLEYLETLTKKYNCSTHLTMNNGLDVGCLCFKRHFSVSPFGDVLPCPWIMISMGNLFEENLETILNRGLANPWFKFGNKFTCHSGNEDSIFYQEIIPQIDTFDEYPVDWKKIDWHFDKI